MKTEEGALVNALIGAHVHRAVPEALFPVQINPIYHPIQVCAGVDARRNIREPIVPGSII